MMMMMILILILILLLLRLNWLCPLSIPALASQESEGKRRGRRKEQGPSLDEGSEGWFQKMVLSW
jgi:hypothetical protein